MLPASLRSQGGGFRREGGMLARNSNLRTLRTPRDPRVLTFTDWVPPSPLPLPKLVPIRRGAPPPSILLKDIGIYRERRCLSHSMHQKPHPPRTLRPTVGLCLGPFDGPRGCVFLMSEVPPYYERRCLTHSMLPASLRSQSGGFRREGGLFRRV